MNFTIRPETEKDYREVENLTREAFWDVYKPGCSEHFILHKMRSVPAFVVQLDFVALDAGELVGNIVYTKAKVVDSKNRSHEVLTLGPVGVLPSYQGKGVGSLLIEHTLKLAKEMGYKAVFLFGNPAYYSRFGFQNAETYGVQTSDGQNFDAFMALELYSGSLEGITGKLMDDPVFEVEEKAFEEYEKRFPYKEKHKTDTQLK